MRKGLLVAMLPMLLTGASLGANCESAIAGTQGQPCCYRANGFSYSSTYGADGKCQKPRSLPWYMCLLQSVEGVA